MKRFDTKTIAVQELAYTTFRPNGISGRAETNVASDSAKPLCVLMVGMHLTKTRGGITTLITGLLRSDLRDDLELIYVESQSEESATIGKMVLAFRAICRFVWNSALRQPKLVYVHLGSNASLYRESVFIVLAKLFGKKVLTHFHAGDIDDYYPLQTRIGQAFIRKALTLSDLVIAVSNKSAEQLRNICRTADISVLPNAIDTSIFDRPFERNPDDGKIRLLFVGAVGKLKGERDLVAAIANLRDKIPQLRISILGYGAESMIEYCRKLKVTDLIEHLGPVPMTERVSFFQKCDIFVLPTYAEAMPISVIEAMAAGLPTIATTVGGIPELIDDGVNGFLVRPGDIEMLSAKIEILANDSDLRRKMGSLAKAKSQGQMSFGTYVKELKRKIMNVSEGENE